jgi:hypothetical protein
MRLLSGFLAPAARQVPGREQIQRLQDCNFMNHRKNNSTCGTEFDPFSEKSRERLNDADSENREKLEALEMLFAECEVCPKAFHELYVRPLLEQGLSPDSAFDLLVRGTISSN